MVENLKDHMAVNIVLKSLFLLGGKRVYQRRGSLFLVTGEPGKYYLTIQKEGDSRLTITELITLDEKDETLSYFWSFVQAEGEWGLAVSSKNERDHDRELLPRELADLRERLVESNEGRLGHFLEPPDSSRTFNSTFGPYLKKSYTSLYMLIASAVLVLGLFVTLFSGNIQYNRMVRIVNQLDRTISLSATLNDNVLKDLNRQISSVTADLAAVEASLNRDQQNLEFNRFNMAEMVKLSVSDVPSWQTSRRTAYFYLSGLMGQASSFGELYYHFTRLPRSESEADLLLATDKENILELDSYDLVFSHLLYPVREDSGKNDGKGFIISSGYSSSRNSPLGEGGYKPHYAVDIINISNILKLTPQDRLDMLKRDNESPGAVVSVDDGKVIYNADMADYGWSVEIEHSISSEIRASFPHVTRFTTFYAHLAEKSNAKTGNFIRRDEKIGDIGNTGKSTGPHLHFEVRIHYPKGKQTGFDGSSFDSINPLTMK